MSEQFKEYSIVRLDANNIKHLTTLSKAVWGHSNAEHIFYLKYFHPESRYAFLGYFAFDKDGTAVGFQGACQLKIAYGEETKIIAQSTDTMTHPDHGGKGLIGYLGKKTYQLCKNLDMSGVVGYANQNFLYILVHKFGFAIADRLQAYRIPIQTLPLEKISAKLPFINKIYKPYQDLFFNRHTVSYQIPYSFSRDDQPILLREDHLIAYKKARGVFSLRLGNTLLWVKINRDLFIGDMICPNEEEFIGVLKKIKQLCFWAGIRTIHFQSCKGSKEESYFAKHHTARESLPLCYLSYDNTFPFENYKSTFGDIDIF